jgi:hypothetical protein
MAYSVEISLDQPRQFERRQQGQRAGSCRPDPPPPRQFPSKSVPSALFDGNWALVRPSGPLGGYPLDLTPPCIRRGAQAS